MFRNRMLGGGVSYLALMRPDDGTGTGTGTGTGAGTGTGDAAAAVAAAAAAAAGAAGTPADKTLAGGGAGAADAAAAAAAAAAKAPFGDKWREDLAGDDKDALKDLAKYTDPKAVYKSLRDVQTKISKGELKAPPAALAKDATPEQLAAHRTANGLPDKPEGYVEKLALPNGVVIGEADKPLVNEFAKAMFDQGASQDEMNRAVGWFYQQQAIAEGHRAEADSQARVASEVELRGEWGGDFKGNMNAVGAVLALMPEELKGSLLTARTPDGQMIGNTAAFNRWAASLGRELNPAATLIPANGGDSVKAVADEIASIDAIYRKAVTGDGEARRAYYGSDGKPGLDARQRELIDAQQKMATRGKAA